MSKMLAKNEQNKKVQRLSSDVMCDIILVMDFLIIMLTAFLAKLAYIDGYLGLNEEYGKFLNPSLLAAFIFCYLSAQRHLYTLKYLRDLRISVFSSLLNLSISFLILIAIGFIFKFAHLYSRGWLLTWLAFSGLSFVFFRWSIDRTFNRLRRQGYFRRRIAIVSSLSDAAAIRNAIRVADHDSDFAGIFNDAQSNFYTGDMADIIGIGQDKGFDEIYIAIPFDRPKEIRRAIDRLSVLSTEVWVCPPDLELPVPARDFMQVGSVTALKVQAKPITDRGVVLKLLEDYILGSLAFLVFLPIFILIAIAIKLDSKGPVFFIQRRHGVNHKVIDVWKFRTMTVMEDDESIVQAKSGDKRITRVGKILRKTSLDELPQLINVLKGEMSLVGPRPHALSHNAYYSEILQYYDNRHRVKPGMTGWAQINGYRGPTQNPEMMLRRVQLDLHYIDNWSIWLDLKILLATPFFGFMHKNAV